MPLATALDKHELVYQRSKIIATIGPASANPETIEELLLAGVRGFRFNFSHITPEGYPKITEQIAWIREISRKHSRPVAIFQDIQGPKVRLGEISDNHFEVKQGDELELVYGAEHDGKTLPVQYDLSSKVKVGQRVLMYDGRIHSEAIAVDENKRSITVKVENDGVLMTKKGINLPDTDFAGDILTDKDYRDIDFGATQDFDYVALSFVQTAHDIDVLRGYLASKNSEADIIAKIETKPAIEKTELEKIVESSDAVMVARGDLAPEVGAEIVPVVQREIIRLCQKHAKISIVATQMMVSMVDSPQPTRAEVTDVSTAVTLGTDCLMLSEETAMGKYPVKTIDSMRNVITYTQANVPVEALDRPDLKRSASIAISDSAVTLARVVEAQAIVAETRSGATAHQISAMRPKRPLLSVTSDERVAQKMALLYANRSFVRPDGERVGLQLMQEMAEIGYIKKPAKVVIVSGRQPGVVGGTDTIKVRTVE
ncbi:pyruvate kinase [Candidatus Saccharibacteria bacterium]|nr:MAG: pyruvate kinase [Candidatus Saccharibacteria bacterium]